MPAIIDTPVFIIGNPRSGTSLLRLMISAHSKISIPPESGFLVWWYTKYKDWTKQDSANDTKVEQYITDLKKSKKIETWKLDFDRLKYFVKTELPTNYAELSSLVYYTYAQTKDKPITLWGDKNNYYIAHLNELAEIYPNAYFVHIIRDGRDVACSYLNIANIDSTSPYKPILPNKMVEIAKEWSTNNTKIGAFLSQIAEPKKILIKYEDLIENSADVLMALCKFLALPYETGMMNFYETEKEPEEFIAWKKKTMEKPDPKNKNFFLNHLSSADITIFNQNAADILNLYGYTI